ncbi:MAG TPA: SurA N-terminal domain-containing protein [Pyrinomonadaceae bacterium]|nr:SurA N-terminal domain-containing protein [Pyrinomonadaceae bacterium]
MQRFVKSVATFALVALSALALAACDGKPGAGAGNAASDVAASVNGTKIMMSEVERLIEQQARGQQLSPLQRAAARLTVIENLIQQQVLVQRAEKEGAMPKDDEIDAAINSRKASATQEEWNKFLQENKLTDQALRDEARKALAVQKLQEKLIGKISISDRQVEEFYNNNKAQFVNARGVGLSAVVVDPVENQGLADDAKSPEDAKAKIDRLYSQLRNGADFADVARNSSEDTSALRGGDLGFATEDDLKQNGFDEALIRSFFDQGAMQVGSYSQPVRFGNGRWYVFKLTSRNLQNENLTLDSPGVRDRIKEALRNQQQQLLNAALVQSATNEAKIENYFAQNLLNDPNSVNSLQPAGAATTTATSPAPAATTTPAASGTPNQ